MLKKLIIAIVVVFVAVEVMDFILHSFLLKGLYESATFWRPMEEAAKLMWVIHLATFLQTAGFVLIYHYLISKKSLKRGMVYGLLFGFSNGMTMGYVMYALLPMPYGIAAGWFWGSIVLFGIAGWLTALLLKEKTV